MALIITDEQRRSLIRVSLGTDLRRRYIDNIAINNFNTDASFLNQLKSDCIRDRIRDRIRNPNNTAILYLLILVY
ncbi:MAG: hypothetical protein LQ351_006676 [Letrouitia transgressa]|nr:MAG: hypothetical protein LQ351_006676 [Letrouitia transgressa]